MNQWKRPRWIGAFAICAALIAAPAAAQPRPFPLTPLQPIDNEALVGGFTCSVYQGRNEIVAMDDQAGVIRYRGGQMMLRRMNPRLPFNPADLRSLALIATSRNHSVTLQFLRRPGRTEERSGSVRIPVRLGVMRQRGAAREAASLDTFLTCSS